MRFAAVYGFGTRSAADTLIVPFWEATHPKNATSYDIKGKAILDLGDFRGKEGETLFFYPSSYPEKRVLLLGLGKKSKVELDAFRRAYAIAVRSLYHKKSSSINVLLPECDSFDREEIIRAVSEGLLLGNYKYTKLKKDTLKSKPYYPIKTARLIGLHRNELPITAKARKLVGAVNFARDLVNENADDKSPDQMADIAISLARKFSSVRTTILDKKRLEQEGFGLILAVSRASDKDPNLIVISYEGAPKDPEKVVLVGKGVVYDTGGLSLKPTSNMYTMKSDMGGSATVFGTLAACAMLGIKKNVVAVVPCVENAIGNRSYKIGDVYTSYSGKTVEITNTDAEGRLVLADAISYALEKLNPSYLIDFATLTGGVVVALGEEIMGYYTHDEKIYQTMEKASKDSGELAWQLPLHLPYAKLLHSDVADIKNSGERWAHSIQGGLFLHAFVSKDVPWMHLDIAGPAFLSKSVGVHPQFGTGAGVRLAVSFIEQLVGNE